MKAKHTLTAIATATFILAQFCWCGCESAGNTSFTMQLWQGDYIVPPPDPKLALAQTPQGILVQYDALYEQSGNLHRRAYYLEPNLKLIEAKQKPVFVNPAKMGPQTVIPIFPRPVTTGSPPELYAVSSSDLCAFTLFREGKILGPYYLPVYKSEQKMAAKVALTPLAVTGDAGVAATATAALGGCVWALFHAGGAAETTDPAP